MRQSQRRRQLFPVSIAEHQCNCAVSSQTVPCLHSLRNLQKRATHRKIDDNPRFFANV